MHGIIQNFYFLFFSGDRACLRPLIRVHVTRRYVFGMHLVCGGICMSRPKRGRSVMLSEIPGPSVLRMLVPLWGSTWQNKSVVPDYRLRLDGISGILLILVSFLTY